MNNLMTVWIVSWLAFLLDWSIRWGVVLTGLAAWFALRPPRRAAIRHALCVACLLAGFSLPVVPRWGDATFAWPVAAKPMLPVPPVPQAGARMPAGSGGAVVRPPKPAEPTTGPNGSSDLVRTPRPSAPAQERSARVIAVWALGVISVGTMTILAARMLAGRRLLARLRDEAQEIGESSRMLLCDCRDTLRLSRRAGLAVHPAVASPVTLGGLRPLVLVPPDWDTWPESHRRACLLHELAHLSRFDDWAKLVQEVVRIPLFFHPLVHWLLARLDREREILCDEAVVTHGGDATDYVRLLLHLAKRPGRVLSGAAALRPGWLSFLDRRTVALRIERLLEDDMLHAPFHAYSRQRVFALGALSLAVGVSVGSLRVRTVAAQDRPGPGAIRTTMVKPTARAITGTVLDSEGKPVADAVVVAGLSDIGTLNHHVFKSDSEGRFSWPIPAGALSLSLYAHRPGGTPTSSIRWLNADKTGDDIELRLGKPHSGPFAAVLVDSEQKPVAGAKVRIEMSALNSESRQPDGSSRWSGTVFFYYRREILEGSPLDALFIATTDNRGAFSFGSFGPDSWLRLRVTTPDGREMRVKGRIKAEGAIGSMMDEQGFVSAPRGKQTQLVVYPAARVNGRVVTKLPGVSVSGLRISFQASRVSEDRPASQSNFGGVTRTDGNGRFTLDDLNEGTINIFVSDAENVPMNRADSSWTYRAAQDIELRSGGTNEALIELIRGVEVSGKVLTSDGQPLEGANIGIHGPMRPRSGAAVVSATTDTEGRYRYRLPGGATYVYVMGHPPGHADRNVHVPEGVDRFEVPPIVMDHVLVGRGRVSNAAGNPVPGAIVTSVGERGRIFGPGVDAVTDSLGKFTLSPSPNNSIPFGQAARLLIRLPDGTEHEVKAIPTADGSVSVKLPISTGSPPRASSAPPPAGRSTHPDPQIILAEHVLLWDDRIVTWDEVVKRLRAMRSRGPFRATFHTSNGLHRRKDGWKDYHDRIMAIYREIFEPVGVTFASLSPRGSTRYDAIRTEGDLIPDPKRARAGQVVTPQGEPAREAQVIVLPTDGPLAMLNLALSGTELRDPYDERWSPTDRAGRFVVHPDEGSYFLAVLHPSGFAVHLGDGQNEVIQLQPWAILTFRSTGGAVDQKADVSIRPAGVRRGMPGVQVYSVQTKGQPIEIKVPAGDIVVSRSLDMGQGTAVAIPVEEFTLGPGATRALEVKAPSQADRDRARTRYERLHPDQTDNR